MFAPVDTIPGSFVEEVHQDTNTVRNEDKDSCLLYAFSNCICNSTIDDDTKDTVGDSFDSRTTSVFSVHG